MSRPIYVTLTMRDGVPGLEAQVADGLRATLAVIASMLTVEPGGPGEVHVHAHAVSVAHWLIDMAETMQGEGKSVSLSGPMVADCVGDA